MYKRYIFFFRIKFSYMHGLQIRAGGISISLKSKKIGCSKPFHALCLLFLWVQ